MNYSATAPEIPLFHKKMQQHHFQKWVMLFEISGGEKDSLPIKIPFGPISRIEYYAQLSRLPGITAV